MNSLFTSGHGLVIGVGQDLPVTIDDAKAVANLLRDPSRCAYPSDQVQLLTGSDAKKDQILAAFDKLAVQTTMNPDSTVLVYFSGHGIATPDFHILPFGYDVTRLSETAINSQILNDKLRALAAKKLVVILDCCHAEGQADAKIPKSIQAPLAEEILAEYGLGSGRVILASSHRDEFSFTGQPYSVFTAALLEAFAGHGASLKDGFVRIIDVALYVYRMVANRTNDKQHPMFKAADLENNFVLAYYSGGDKEIKLSNSDQPPSPSTNNTLSSYEIESLKELLALKKEHLSIIIEHMNQYIDFKMIPLDTIYNKRRIEKEIGELEKKLM